MTVRQRRDWLQQLDDCSRKELMFIEQGDYDAACVEDRRRLDLSRKAFTDPIVPDEMAGLLPLIESIHSLDQKIQQRAANARDLLSGESRQQATHRRAAQSYSGQEQGHG